MEHSRLLKFVLKTERSPKMSEETSKEFQNPVEAEVPTSQNLREANIIHEFGQDNTDGAVSNIEENQSGSYRIVKRSYTETRSATAQAGEVVATTIRLTSGDGKEVNEEITAVEERKARTKIPKLKFRQTVQRVLAEEKKVEDNESQKSKINRRSKIPPPSTKPIVTKRNSALMDDEFEKIYEDLIDEQFNFDEHILGDNDEDKLEMKFEEIIHDYDENRVQPINVEEVIQSRKPHGRRRSDHGIDSKVEKDSRGTKAVPFARSKSVHDTESAIEAKMDKNKNSKEKTKHTSSIPLPRRKSGQDADLTKTTYNKSEKDGVVTETVTTITKSAPISHITLDRGSVSITTYDSNVKSKDSKEYSFENQGKTKIRKSIPVLIGSRNDGRKVIRTYTRTVTTEKVESGNDKNISNVTTHDVVECNTINESEKCKKESQETVHSQQEENIIKDSIRIGIPVLEAKSESNDENTQTVQVTKILEWNTNIVDTIDSKTECSKLEIKNDNSENNNIKSDENIQAINESNKLSTIESKHIEDHSIKHDKQNTPEVKENRIFKATEIVKETTEIGATTTTTIEKQISTEKETLKEVNVKERDGSRFNKVSNLTILKGVDNNDEILTSPRLLIKNKKETETEIKSNKLTDEDTKIESIKDSKVNEALKSPKLDKDGNADILPEYNIRIKRFSREMKYGDESLKQWEGHEKVNTEDKSTSNEINTSTNSHTTRTKLQISNMDNARNLLSRVLDRERKTETIQPETKEINNNVTQNTENDVTSKTEENIKKTTIRQTLKTTDTSLSETEFKHQVRNEAENINQESYSISDNKDVTVPVHNNKEDIEELGIKGKVGRLINRIDGKELVNDSMKKEEVPVRRSVLSKIAMFERQEPLESIKTRKPRQELRKPSNLILKEEEGQTHAHVHTPKIVEEVLKSADWDLNHKDGDNTEITWKIDFDKIITNREETISNLNEKSEHDQTQRVVPLLKDKDMCAIKTKETIENDENLISRDIKVDIASEIEKKKNSVTNEHTLATTHTNVKVNINEDLNTANSLHDSITKIEKIESNKLRPERSVRDMATSPIRLSFDGDFESKLKNQVLTDAPVIIVKINDNMSKSTEAIYSTQPKTTKKVDRTTSMTEKLYPEKVKANIALYESIKNETYKTKSESKGFERSSDAIFEIYKNERYAKANKTDTRLPYTPQNSVNNDYASLNECTKNTIPPYKYESSVSVDESKINTRNRSSYTQKYGSLQYINETNADTLIYEPIKNEAITEMNKSVYRLTFDDSKPELDNEIENNHSNKRETIQSNVKTHYEEIGAKPINEIIVESYEMNKYNEDKVINDSKIRIKSKHDEDDESGERMVKSLPNFEGKPVKNKVRMLSRLRSVDHEESRDFVNKKTPSRISVLEKIALFEGKAQQLKTEQSSLRSRCISSQRPPAQYYYTEKEYSERIEELQNAKKRYGSMKEIPTLVLRNGREMPVLAVGTALVDPQLAKYVISAAIDLGYRAIDTGYTYGNEKEVGEAIKAKIEEGAVTREELFISGKLWSTFHRTDLVETACRASLDNLGLEYFDLYMIHNPMSFKEGPDPLPKIATVLQYSQYDYLDAWYGMEVLVSKGLAKTIGVSNFNSVQIQRILDKGKVKPAVNQVECHPYLTQQRLDQFCSERNIRLSCFGVLGSKGTPAEYKNSTTPVIDDALVKVMASGLNVSPAQLLIRYQLECDRAVVVKSSSAAHLWDNLQALTLNLTTGQVEALHALNRNKRTFVFIGMGDTHKNYPFKIQF